MREQGIFLWAVAFLNLLLAAFILFRNSKNRTNVLFSVLNISAAAWSAGLAAFLFSDSPRVALLWAQLYYAAAALIAFFFLVFSIDFTGNWKKFRAKYLWLSLLPPLIVGVLIFASPRLLLTSVVRRNWGKEVILNKSGYTFYSVYFIFYVLVGFAIIFRTLKTARGLFKTYLKFLFNGLVVAFALGASFNLFYPALGNYRYIWVGPLFILVYTALTTYAIVKHKLFDVRAFVVRAIAYALTFSVIAVLYVVPALLLTNYLLDAKLRFTTIFVLAVVTLLTGILFQSLRKYFNLATQRLFYHDYYEPQAVLDRLSSLLAGSVDLAEIEKDSAKILQNALKTSFLKYYLRTQAATEDEREALQALHAIKEELVVFDDLDMHKYVELRPKMGEMGAAVAVRLRTRRDDLGFMLLGFKQSGAPYTEEDQRLLRTSADEIAIGLQNALRFEQIRRFNVTLQEKIDEATRELRRANARLRELDKTKDEFISMASHQLRTPLTTVKGYLSMVLEGDMGAVKKDQKEVLQNAFDGANRMVYLIADLLNVSRLQSGKFVIDNKPTDLAALVAGEVTQLQAQAASRQIELAYQKPEHFPVLNLDETKIRQVVMNFLDNAIYYTPKGGKVTAVLEATDKLVNYTVTDTGVGVPKEVQHHLFSKFYRADNARKMRPDGTGLGLFMAKKVVVAEGGSIIFKSVEGKGSTFGFSFPRKSLELKGEKAVVTDTVKGPELPPPLTPAKKG